MRSFTLVEIYCDQMDVLAAQGRSYEYVRKLAVGAQIAASANGLDGMREKLAFLRRMDADPVVIGELERIYHRECVRTLPAQ